MKIKLPNGQMADFPDNTSPEIIERVKQQYSGAPTGIEAQPSPENLLQKVMRYGLKDPLVGMADIGHGLLNIPSKATGLFSESAGKALAYKPDFDYSKAVLGQEADTGDKLIQGLTEIAPAFALPGANIGRAGEAIESIPRAGRYLKAIVEQGLPQAGYAAAVSPDSPVEASSSAASGVAPFAALAEFMKNASPSARLAALAAGVGVGGLGSREAVKSAGGGEIPADIAGVVGGALATRGLKPKSARMSEMLGDTKLADATPKLEASERLGLDYLTPAEATSSPYLARKEGQLGKTAESSKEFYQKGQQRLDSERNAIHNVLDTIYTPDLDPKIKSLYHHAYDVTLPEGFLNQYQGDQVFNSALKKVQNKPAYQKALNDIPQNSVAYLDVVKNALYDMEQQAARKGANKEAAVIKNTRRDLVSQLDEISPDYPHARQLHERKEIRKSLESVFDRKDMTGKNFYNALASESKFNDLIGKLRNVPEAQDKLKDMRLVFRDLMPPPTIRTAKGHEERNLYNARNSGEFMINLLQNMLGGGKYDKEMINLITSKEWPQHYERLNTISNKQQKVAYLIDLLGKGAGQTLAQEIED
jgi:hypothetical protein